MFKMFLICSKLYDTHKSFKPLEGIEEEDIWG